MDEENSSPILFSHTQFPFEGIRYGLMADAMGTLKLCLKFCVCTRQFNGSDRTCNKGNTCEKVYIRASTSHYSSFYVFRKHYVCVNCLFCLPRLGKEIFKRLGGKRYYTVASNSSNPKQTLYVSVPPLCLWGWQTLSFHCLFGRGGACPVRPSRWQQAKRVLQPYQSDLLKELLDQVGILTPEGWVSYCRSVLPPPTPPREVNTNLSPLSAPGISLFQGAGVISTKLKPLWDNLATILRLLFPETDTSVGEIW